jgi:hypothetical protein
MARQKRYINTFSLSFLDIMACGFGAVTLLFLILKHDASTSVQNGATDMRAEARLLAEDIREGQRERVKLRNSLELLDSDILTAEGMSRRVLEELDIRKKELSIQESPDNKIALLRRQIDEMETKTAQLREDDRGNDTRSFIGSGERQYLTGLKLGGQRVLILLDVSASMLDESIINIVRRRNMSDAVRRGSAKWQRAVRTVEWLVSQLPANSRYQIYTFNTIATPLSAGSMGKWQDAADAASLDAAIKHLQNIAPEGGTSLYNAFDAARGFSLRPDNIFLLTDGLPTQGQKPPRRNTVSGKIRGDLFNEALTVLPRGIPVNIILFPMEGDPAAAALFWRLALSTHGAFLSPAKDWP